MEMLKDERQDRIMQYLYQERKVAVTELCTLLNVSPATIRRDIEEFASEEFVKRPHGGIVLPDSTKFEPPVLQRRYLEIFTRLLMVSLSSSSNRRKAKIN